MIAVTGDVVRQARVAHRIGSALRRSADLRLWAAVQEIGRDPGAGELHFAVPSQSQPGLVHAVAKRVGGAPSQPTWARYSCSCEAGRREACIHRAAVFQALYRKHFGVVPVSVASIAAVAAVATSGASAPAQRVSRAVA